MYIITGKITENGRDRAYTVYGIKEQRACFMSRKDVKSMLIRDEKFYGLEMNVNAYGNDNIHKTKTSIFWSRIPEMNGKCEPENPKDKDLKVLIGTNGYKEVRHFITANTLGQVFIYNKEEIQEEIRKGNIIGAINADDGRVIVYIKNELSDKWVANLGYERDENSMWRKKAEPTSETK